MVLERESRLSTLEFPPDSVEAKVMEKAEPILRRPIVFHTTLAPMTEEGFDWLCQTTGNILENGLLSGKTTGMGGKHEDVYWEYQEVEVEARRQRERFEVEAKPPFNLSNIYERVLERLSVSRREDLLSEFELNYGVSFLLERYPQEGEIYQHGIGRTYGWIPTEQIKGAVLLNAESVGHVSVNFDSELIRQLRQDYLAQLEEYWQDPVLIILDSVDHKQPYWLDDSLTHQFLHQFVLEEHREILARLLSVIREKLPEFQKQSTKIGKKESQIEKLLDETFSLGSKYFLHTSSYSKRELSEAKSLLCKWMGHFIILIMAKVSQRKNRVKWLLENDDGSLELQTGMRREKVEQLIKVVANSFHPLLVYDDCGNLLWPAKIEFEQILDNWLRERGFIR